MFLQRGSCHLGEYLIFCPQAEASVRHTAFRTSSGVFKAMSFFKRAKMGEVHWETQSQSKVG